MLQPSVLTLFGGASVTVLGVGLAVLAAHSLSVGIALAVIGFGGIAIVALCLSGRPPKVRMWLIILPYVLALALVVTWIMIGYDIFFRFAQNASHQYSASIGNYHRNMGPISTLDTISAAGGLWKHLRQGTAVLITSGDPKDNIIFGSLQHLLSTGVQVMKSGPIPKMLLLPDYRIDIDAPKPAASPLNGIVIHAPRQAFDGTSDINEMLQETFSCFIVRITNITDNRLAGFYNVPRVLWIEIGKDSPWRASRGSEQWACQD